MAAKSLSTDRHFIATTPKGPSAGDNVGFGQTFADIEKDAQLLKLGKDFQRAWEYKDMVTAAWKANPIPEGKEAVEAADRAIFRLAVQIDSIPSYSLAGTRVKAIARYIPSGISVGDHSVENDVVPVVFVQNGGVFASSHDVARVFKKNHFHVLRDIDALISHPDLDNLWFQEVTEYNEAANKEVRYFNLTRDGFVLLVMGYTGKTAINLKIRWIQEFNRMEEELRGGHVGNVLVIAARVTELLETRLTKISAQGKSHPHALPYGKTSGEIWYGYGLPTIKNGPMWLGNRLEELGCLLAEGGKVQLGRTRTRIFDPVKVKDVMRDGLLASAKRYAEQRLDHPQMKLIA